MSPIAFKAESLLSSLRSKGIDAVRNLREGASEQMLRSYEKRFKCELPASVKELYRWRNGNVDSDTDAEHLFVFRDMAFLSLSDGIQARDQIDVFLEAIAAGKTPAFGDDGYVPIGGLEGQFYVVPCGDHAFRDLADHPVVAVGDELAVHFLSIESMLDTCNAWVADPSYTLATLKPEDESEAWNRFNPGALNEEAFRWAAEDVAEEARDLGIHDLYEAVAQCDEGRALAIIASGVQIDCTDAFGRTLMHDAIRRGMDAAKLALSLGCNLNAECSKHWTPLFHLRKYEEPTAENLEVHRWALECGAFAKPDRLAEFWGESG